MKELFLMALALLLGLGACSESGSGDEIDGGPDADGDADTDSDSDADSDGDGDADGDTASEADTSSWDEVDTDTYGDLPCPDPDAGFVEEDPGISLSFTVQNIDILGQPNAISYALVLPAAREDFSAGEGGGEDVPIDTCVPVESSQPTPECATDDDCAPEQVCVPEYDSDNQPIEGSEHCVTPRDPLDVGPLGVYGFDNEWTTFAYNPGESGAYTYPGAGAQLADPSVIAYDTEYIVIGQGDEAQGLGACWGHFYMPAQLEITSPPFVDTQTGPAIEVDTTQDLTLEWSGSNPDGIVRIDLEGGAIADSGTPHVCVVEDDGEFTIPADVLQQLGLGAIAFFNMWTISRSGSGEICGDGVSVGWIGGSQQVMFSVMKTQ